MRDLLNLIRWMLFRLFRSRTSLKVGVVISRHQLKMLHRRSPRPLGFSNFDGVLVVRLYPIAPRNAAFSPTDHRSHRHAESF
jgi:hypothetical protein